MTELQRLARRLADDYEFECQGGPLRNCTEWRALCEAIDTLAVAPPSGASPQAESPEQHGEPGVSGKRSLTLAVLVGR